MPAWFKEVWFQVLLWGVSINVLFVIFAWPLVHC
ncbi:hypothetical protein LCGC14_1016270 [marine sediment metagenome]|uniref:Uncharacterized protein n=1 Tax=marine sediment metagenome TaxID=412755 RepID=A0A0F9MYQ1_9ZZZZ